MHSATHSGVSIERITVSAYTVPAGTPKSGGTLEWGKATPLLVERQSRGKWALAENAVMTIPFPGEV
jgi:hypothetical protein